jgi:hypothetical protein
MELTETHNLPVAHNVSWKALNDTEILRACIPVANAWKPMAKTRLRSQ